jgi:hypothetical protein
VFEEELGSRPARREEKKADVAVKCPRSEEDS